jgi:hypothetical protein
VIPNCSASFTRHAARGVSAAALRLDVKRTQSKDAQNRGSDMYGMYEQSAIEQSCICVIERGISFSFFNQSYRHITNRFTYPEVVNIECCEHQSSEDRFTCKFRQCRWRWSAILEIRRLSGVVQKIRLLRFHVDRLASCRIQFQSSVSAVFVYNCQQLHGCCSNVLLTTPSPATDNRPTPCNRSLPVIIF